MLVNLIYIGSKGDKSLNLVIITANQCYLEHEDTCSAHLIDVCSSPAQIFRNFIQARVVKLQVGCLMSFIWEVEVDTSFQQKRDSWVHISACFLNLPVNANAEGCSVRVVWGVKLEPELVYEVLNDPEIRFAHNNMHSTLHTILFTIFELDLLATFFHELRRMSLFCIEFFKLLFHLDLGVVGILCLVCVTASSLLLALFQFLVCIPFILLLS